MKKLYIFLTITVISLLAGCTTPGKLIASSSSTVDHAMQAWAIYVVDGKATIAQENMVRAYKIKYDAAEDAAVEANLKFATTGDKAAWKLAKEYLTEQKDNLINLVSSLTGKAL